MRRIALGLIGAGKHGQRYLHHVRTDVPELRLAALCRRDGGAGRVQADEVGAVFHADWQALVADPAVEAVAAVVPPILHPPIAAAVAAARKPLLIEKPLATTGAAALEVVHTLRRAGIPVLMAHTLRWNTVVRAIRDHVPALGPVRALYLSQRFEPSRLAWLDDPGIAGGGIVLHTGVHSFDLVRWLTGREVVRVWCRTARAVTRRTEDNFLAILELEGSAAMVGVNGSRATQARAGLIDVACEGGQLIGDHTRAEAWKADGITRAALPLAEPVPTVREALRAFVRLVLDGETPPVAVEDGAAAVLIAEACLRSWASGEGVPVARPSSAGWSPKA